jgi:hypothetical protein
MKQNIKVKHILNLLKDCDPEASIDFFNFGTSFDEADVSQLKCVGGYDKDVQVHVYVIEHVNKEDIMCTENKVESYIKAHWYDENQSDVLTLLIDEGYLKAAVSYLVGAGAIEPENSNNPKMERLCLKYLENYTFQNQDEDINDCLTQINPAIFVNEETNEHYFPRNKSDFDPDNNTKFLKYWNDPEE